MKRITRKKVVRFLFLVQNWYAKGESVSFFGASYCVCFPSHPLSASWSDKSQLKKRIFVSFAPYLYRARCFFITNLEVVLWVNIKKTSKMPAASRLCSIWPPATPVSLSEKQTMNTAPKHTAALWLRRARICFTGSRRISEEEVRWITWRIPVFYSFNYGGKYLLLPIDSLLDPIDLR